MKSLKYILYIIICVILMSCSLSMNPKNYGYDGEVESFNEPIAIRPSEDLEQDNLKMIKTSDFYHKFSKEENFHEENPLTLLNFIFEDTKYELGKINYGEFYLMGTEHEYGDNNPFNIKEYSTVPVGVTSYKGRRCIVILHHGKKISRSMENNIIINGNIKGYQLIDIRTGLEVRVDIKTNMYANDVKITSIHVETFIE